jgi:hypothetical protein
VRLDHFTGVTGSTQDQPEKTPVQQRTPELLGSAQNRIFNFRWR